MALSAFHGDQAIKDKYIARVAAHRAADNLIRGSGWDGHKGCAVGCTLEDYNHAKYETELGIPEWLARVEDNIFEGAEQEYAMDWPGKFLAAIRPGADLESVKAPFLIFVLESTLGNFDHQAFPDCKEAIDGVIALWRLPEAERTESAAWSAAVSARSAAESAAWSAAESARSAAGSAARSAAWSAARSAESAARSAAWSARSAAESAWQKFGDKLLELLTAA
jgi:hypothetical protein